MAKDTILITDDTEADKSAADGSAGDLALPPRYEPGVLLGEGGMAEVRLVRDRELDREVAMKIVRGLRPRTLARFRLEAKTQAALQHPNIVPLYDWGQLQDGRIWYTMQVVRGQRFSELIEELFEPTSLPWGLTESGWSLHRLIQALATVSKAVSYAHSRGVLHRDLKPDNLMVGEFGEVYVLDWGVSRLSTDGWDESEGEDEAGVNAPSGPSGSFTVDGTVIGTPAYMAPEQASGQVDLHSPASDVYALGAVLFELLEGRTPGGCPIGNPEAPQELVDLSNRALSQDPGDRPSAAVLAEVMSTWLDGSRRKAEALEVLDKARAVSLEPLALRNQARVLRDRAAALGEAIATYDPVAKKLPIWALEEEAEGLQSRASLMEGRWEGLIRRALNLDPDMEGAHQDLADWYRGQLERAETRNDRGEAQRCEELVRLHDRGDHRAWLDGEGRVTLRTDPPGATVTIHRYVEQGRRLVPVELQTLQAPLTGLVLDRGSYLFVLHAEGCHPVRYPVALGRLEHWDGVPPGETETQPVYLPRVGELRENECYVPAGWCWLGGGEGAVEPEPRRRAWIDGFVIGRTHVTNRAYLAFLNGLSETDATALVPRDSRPGIDEPAPLYGHDQGTFLFSAPVSVPLMTEDCPAVLVNHSQAAAYAQHHGARLPTSAEWEKAARGVDGRLFPWGNGFDPAFTNITSSQRDPSPQPAGQHLIDRSVYGLNDLAGNAQSWCADHFQKAPGEPLDRRYFFIRGGTFITTAASHCRCSSRFASTGERSLYLLGFRTARSLR